MTTLQSTVKKWTGPVLHLSQTGRPGDRATCGNKRAHMTTSEANFEKEPLEGRCEKCETIRARFAARDKK